MTLLRDSVPVSWEGLAKDGADLPPGQAIQRPAALLIAVGETYDFEFTPTRGEYRLVAEIRKQPVWTGSMVAR
jgi:hypothetical protein